MGQKISGTEEETYILTATSPSLSYTEAVLAMWSKAKMYMQFFALHIYPTQLKGDAVDHVAYSGNFIQATSNSAIQTFLSLISLSLSTVLPICTV